MKAELQAVLNERIPLTAALGMRVLEAGPSRVALAFPLEPNRNHLETVFGASLYASAVLAGWGLLWCALRERGAVASVVIAASTERFLDSADADFTAECACAHEGLDQAFKVLARKGRAKVELKSEVLCRGRCCVRFDGTYGLLGA